MSHGISAMAFFMGTITALTKQKRNPNRVSVFLDGNFAFGVAAITAVSLQVGQTLTATDIERIQQQDQLENAKQTAIRFIGYRPRSVMEVRRHLEKKGFEAAAIDQAIGRLEAINLLDDDEFARYWVEQRETFKPRSQMVLRQELQQKGIERQIIDAVVADIDETAAARQAAEKRMTRWQQLPYDQFAAKLGGYLQRRGFSYDIIREITEEMWQIISSQHQN